MLDVSLRVSFVVSDVRKAVGNHPCPAQLTSELAQDWHASRILKARGCSVEIRETYERGSSEKLNPSRKFRWQREHVDFYSHP